MEIYAELEVQRRHLLDQETPEDRATVMVGINRLLDEMIDRGFEPVALLNSAEGQTHLDKHIDMGCE